MDLPTYTNIWRIEKRLYKLYDFRLPVPLPLVTVGVWLGVTFVWVLLMQLLRVPFQTPWHVLWIVPPMVIAFLATRPVIEGKRLTELARSQVLYTTEARVYTRLAAQHEPARVVLAVRVWRRDPEAGPLPVVDRKAARAAERRRAAEARTAGADLVAPETAPEAAAAPVQAAASAVPTPGQKVLHYFGFAVPRAEPARDADAAATAPPVRRTELGTAKRRDDAPRPLALPVRDTAAATASSGTEDESDAWYTSLGASSGQTPWPLASKSAYAPSDTAAMRAPMTGDAADTRQDAAARAAARRRAEEIMAAPDPAPQAPSQEQTQRAEQGAGWAARAAAADVPTQPSRAADYAEEPPDREPAKRRLRGRTQGAAVTRRLEQVRAHVAESHEGARGYGYADALPASAEGTHAGQGNGSPRPRPHASPWDLPPVARTDAAGVPEHPEPVRDPWTRAAAPTPEAEPTAAGSGPGSGEASAAATSNGQDGPRTSEDTNPEPAETAVADRPAGNGGPHPLLPAEQRERRDVAPAPVAQESAPQPPAGALPAENGTGEPTGVSDDGAQLADRSDRNGAVAGEAGQDEAGAPTAFEVPHPASAERTAADVSASESAVSDSAVTPERNGAVASEANRGAASVPGRTASEVPHSASGERTAADVSASESAVSDSVVTPENHGVATGVADRDGASVSGRTVSEVPHSASGERTAADMPDREAAPTAPLVGDVPGDRTDTPQDDPPERGQVAAESEPPSDAPTEHAPLTRGLVLLPETQRKSLLELDHGTGAWERVADSRDGARVEADAPAGPEPDERGAGGDAPERDAAPTDPDAARERKPSTEIDHGTGAWERVADSRNSASAPERTGAGEQRPADADPAVPAPPFADLRHTERKPRFELDHGTGEHVSFTDVSEHRPTASDLDAIEQAALRKRGAAIPPEKSTEPEPAAPAAAGSTAPESAEAESAEAEATSAAPSAADPESQDEPQRSNRLARNLRSVGTETESAPDSDTTDSADTTAPPAEPARDRGVFTRIAQNARKVGEMLTPARGTSSEQEPSKEPAAAADKPGLQLDHGTGEQQLLSGAENVRVVNGSDGAAAPTGIPDVQPGTVPAPAEHHEAEPASRAAAHTDDSPGGGTRGWRRLARVVTGGNTTAPKTPLPPADIERLRTPFDGPRRIVVLGCTGGAGQTITALMLGHTLAAYRDERVVAVDVNPGSNGLSRRIRTESPETLTSLLANADSIHGYLGLRGYTSQSPSGLEVVATLDDPYVQTLDDRDYASLTGMLERHYKITLLDPAATGVARALPIVDGVVLVAPASADAARAVALTFEWLDGHGYGDLRAKAVVVVNGVSKRSLADVDAAEQVARGGCRAIVRIPWDDHIAAARTVVDVNALRTTTRRAHAALAGVVASGFAAPTPAPPSRTEANR